MTPRVTRLWLAVATAALLTACADATGPTDPDLLLRQNMARWASRGPADYRYVITRFCECLAESAGPTTVVVRNGEVETRRYATGASVHPQYESLFTPVPGLFDLIRRAIDTPAAGLAVRYDDTYGFPASIQIDWVAGTADDEVSYRITEFTPLTAR